MKVKCIWFLAKLPKAINNILEKTAKEKRDAYLKYVLTRDDKEGEVYGQTTRSFIVKYKAGGQPLYSEEIRLVEQENKKNSNNFMC